MLSKQMIMNAQDEENFDDKVKEFADKYLKVKN